MAISLHKYGVNHAINHLYYLAPFANLKSIADRGVLSRERMGKLGIEHRDIADPSVVGRRQDRLVCEGGASIHAHVPLYFNPKNPMLSARRDDQDNIAILCIDPRYVDDPQVFIADGNAASTRTRIFRDRSKNGMQSVDWSFVLGVSGVPPGNGESSRKKCAEVLVPDAVPFDRVRQVFVRTNDCARAAVALDARYESLLVVDPKWYF